MSPSSGRNSGIAIAVALMVGAFIREHDLGKMTGADGGYVVAEDTVLVPDFGFISHARIPDEEFVFYPAAPDLAVEVILPSETRVAIWRKTRTYLENGTRLVWHIYPDDQTVDVVTLSDDGNLVAVTLTAESTITAGEVLPGFTAEVGAFFA